MSTDAVTVGGSRTFAENVVVKWTPSTTETALAVEITVNTALVWQHTFTPEFTSHEVSGSGENWSLEGGTFTVTFSGGGKDGQLNAHEWKFAIEGNKHQFTGLIGVW
jgi:hypothetical protein